jgi:hypothetical protein
VLPCATFLSSYPISCQGNPAQPVSPPSSCLVSSHLTLQTFIHLIYPLSISPKHTFLIQRGQLFSSNPLKSQGDRIRSWSRSCYLCYVTIHRSPRLRLTIYPPNTYNTYSIYQSSLLSCDRARPVLIYLFVPRVQIISVVCSIAHSSIHCCISNTDITFILQTRV